MPGKTLEELVKKLDLENITPEQRLEGIKKMNEEFVKVGIKPMTEEEMVRLANDEKTLETYKKARKVQKVINNKETVREKTKGKFENIPSPLKRSIFFLYDVSGTKEAKEKNKKLAEKMSTIEGQREIFRNLFEKMKAQDLAPLHTDDSHEQIDFLSTNTMEKMFMFETDYPRGEFKKYPPDIFSEEENEIYEQIKGSLQGGGQFTRNVMAMSSPLSLFMPQLSVEDIGKLYAIHGADSLSKDFSDLLNCQVNKEALKYHKPVYNILNRNDFFEEGYGVYALHKDTELTRAMGIDYLSTHEPKNVVFFKYKLGDKDRTPIDSIRITEDDILNNPESKRSVNRQFIFDSIENAKFTGTKEEIRFKQSIALAEIVGADYKHLTFTALEKTIESKIRIAESGDNEYQKAFKAFSKQEQSEILAKLANSEDAVKYMDAIKPLANEIKQHGFVDNPGEAIFEAVFAPKANGSKMAKLSGNEETIARINQIQKEAEAIEIPTDTLNEKEVSFAVFSEFIKPEYIETSFIESTFGPGSSLPAGFNAYDGGITNFFQNTVGNDSRENMHYSRLYSAKARTGAKELIEKFKNGDKQPLADSMKLAFSNCLGVAKTGVDVRSQTNLMKYTSVIELHDILCSEKFKGLVKFTEEEEQFVDFFRAQKKIVDEYRSLREEIYHDAVMKATTGADIKSDRALQDKIVQYNARAYFIERQKAYLTDYNYAMAAKVGGLAGGSEANKRKMFEFERNFLYNPDAYMKELEEHFRGREDEFVSINNIDSYLELPEALYKEDELGIAKSGLISHLAENLTLRHDFQERLEQFEFTAKYATEHGGKPTKDTLKVIETLKGLPCLNKDFPERPTMQELDERIQAYKKAYETLDQHVYDFILEEDGEVDRAQADLGTKLEVAIKRLEAAKSEYILEAKLKAKAVEAERVTLQENYVREEVPQVEDFSPKDTFNRPSRREADQILDESVRVIKDTNAKKFKNEKIDEIFDLMNEWKSNRDNPVGSVFAENVQTKISDLIDDLNEKMLDSDDPMLEEELGMVMRLGSSMEVCVEAKDLIPEAVAENSPYREAYERTTEMIGRLQEERQGDFFDNITAGQKDQYHKTTDSTITALEHIRDAIENEAYNLNGPKLKDIEAKDLMAVSAYRFLHASQTMEISKSILKNSDKAIDTLANNKIVKENMKDFSIYDLNEHLNPRSLGFANIMKQKPKVEVREQNANVKEIDPNAKSLI